MPKHPGELMVSPSNTVFRFIADKNDFELLKLELREQDTVEVLAYSGPSYSIVDKVIDRTRENTATPWSFLDRNGDLVAAYGVGNTSRADIGIVWFLGTDRMKTLGQSVAFVSRTEIHVLIKGRKMLYNYVYSENRVTRNWLKHMGFNEIATIPTLGYMGTGFSLYCYFSSIANRDCFVRWARLHPEKLGRVNRNWDTLCFMTDR